MIEPFGAIEVSEEEIGNYQLEESNVSENDNIIKSGRDLILRLEQRRIQSHYSEQVRNF